MRRLRFLVALVPLAAAGLFALGCSPEDTEPLGEARSALGLPLGGEVEPDGSPATATPIARNGVVRANLLPDGDEDVYSFPGVAGERVHAATMTAFSSGNDSVIELIATDCTTVIEQWFIPAGKPGTP